MTRIIGVAGLIGAGKTSFGEALLESTIKLGITGCIMPLAYPLKVTVAEMLHQYLGLDFNKTLEDLNHPIRKEKYRSFMQSFATDICRTIDADFWIKKLGEFAEVCGVEILIVPDIRFQNEIKFIREHNGCILFVERPGVQATDSHVSENSVSFDDADWVISNSRSKEHLQILASECLDRILEKTE